MRYTHINVTIFDCDILLCDIKHVPRGPQQVLFNTMMYHYGTLYSKWPIFILVNIFIQIVHFYNHNYILVDVAEGK